MPEGLQAWGEFSPPTWLHKYNRDLTDYLKATHMKYDPIGEAYYIPVKVGVDEVVGYNKRNVYGKGPKYVLKYNKELFRGYQYYNPSVQDKADTMVFVEDQISAAAIACSGAWGVCLFGANFSIEKFHNVLENNQRATKAVVWLDNDNDTVCKAAKTMAEYGHMIKKPNMRIGLVTKHSDPKHYTKEKIRQILKEEVEWM